MSLLAAFQGASMLIRVGTVVAGLATLGTLSYCAIDAIGDARETRLRKEAVEDRLKGIRDANERERALKSLPLRAKIWCQVDGAGTACCRPDAVELPRCTHDPASSDKRPD